MTSACSLVSLGTAITRDDSGLLQSAWLVLTGLGSGARHYEFKVYLGPSWSMTREVPHSISTSTGIQTTASTVPRAGSGSSTLGASSDTESVSSRSGRR